MKQENSKYSVYCQLIKLHLVRCMSQIQMSMEQEKTPTFELRKICDKIQAKINELISQVSILQPHEFLGGIRSGTGMNVEDKDKEKSQNQWSPQQCFVLQKLRNDLCRIITSSLPQVVSYESKVNDKIQEIREELQQSKKQVRKEKQSYKDSTLEKDKLRLQILQLEHQNNELTQDIQVIKEKYNETMDLCGKYMKTIKDLEDHQVIQQNTIKALSKSNTISQQYSQPQQFLTANNFNFEISQPKQSLAVKRPANKQINLPMQMKQKINEAEKILIRSPIVNDPILDSSHFQLSTQIVGCQKELLEIQLRQCEKDKTQLMIELEEQRVYTQKLQKEANDLQKLLDGEKKLNEKLDREVYTLINTGKQMKIQLLQEKAKCKHLEQEIDQLEQQISLHSKETTELQAKITQLQMESKNVIKLSDQLQEMNEKLSISQKKYQQLRKIKQQLQSKLQDFQQKLQILQKKQEQHQYKNLQFHQIAKNQSLSKIKQIEEMTSLIKQKYQQKLSIVEKQYREVKQKYKYLKQQNQRLYEGLDMQAKKQIKLQDKYQKIKKSLQQNQEQSNVIKRQKQLCQQKLKTKTYLCKELKRQINISEKSRQFNERKLKRLLISVFPNLLLEMKLIKDEAMIIKSNVAVYKEMLVKASTKHCGEIEGRIHSISDTYRSQLQSLESTLQKSTQLIQSYRQQSQKSQQEKLNLLQRNTNLQTKQRKLDEQTAKKQQQLAQAYQKLSFISQENVNLLKQLENYKIIEKNQLESIETLRSKQHEVLKFYELIDELSKQNQKLKQKLDKFILRNQQYQYSSLTNKLNQTVNNDVSGCMIPQRLLKEKGQPKSKQYLPIKNTQSHSCLLHRPVSNNQSSVILQAQKSPSLEKRSCHNHNKPSTSYDHTLPYHLPIQSRPAQFNSRKMISSPFVQKFQSLNSMQDNSGFNDQREKMKHEFENQRNRLENIRDEYQRLMIDKFRDEMSQNTQIQRGNYVRK